MNDTEIDMVNNPPHYLDQASGIECIDIVRHRNYNIGNAIKYLWRAGLKNEDKHIEDLKKAIFYINDEIKRLEAINGTIKKDVESIRSSIYTPPTSDDIRRYHPTAWGPYQDQG